MEERQLTLITKKQAAAQDMMALFQKIICMCVSSWIRD